MDVQDVELLRILAELQDRTFRGRRVITSAVDSITAENIVQIMQNAIAIHNANVADITFLYNYYRGIQPILLRTKQIRPEINNKIVENHAYEAVAFKLSYEFSYPVQYVTRGTDKADQISSLDRFMRSENKYTDDGEIAQWMYICGQGYRFCLPDKIADESPFRLASVDPRNGFVIYSADAFRKPLAGVVITKDINGQTIYTIYTPNTYFTYINGKIDKNEPTPLGYVPVIEYHLNPERMGTFEPVIPLFNAINILGSNGLDGVEQIIQAILAFINVEIDQGQLDAAAENGAICVKGIPGLPADVKSIAEKISQSELDAKADRLYRVALTIMGIPDRAAQSSGGDTGEAVALRNGWSVAEARALLTERHWNASENQFLKLALRICRDVAPDKIKDLDISDLDIKFTRNLSENLLVKTQGLNNLKTAGINKEMAIQAVGLFSDPHAVSEASAEWDKLKSTITIAFKDLPDAAKIQVAQSEGITLTEADLKIEPASVVTPNPNKTVDEPPQA